MLSRFPVHPRKLRCALLSFASLAFSIHAAADTGDYRVRDTTLPTGVRVIQRVDAMTFPQTEGKRPTSSYVEGPSVDAGHLRSVRALVPRKANHDFVLALRDGSAYIRIDFYNHALVVAYGGPSVTGTAVPFWDKDKQVAWDESAAHRWSRTINIGHRISAKATHFLVALHVVPRLDDESPRPSAPNLVVTVHEATVQGMNVVRGRSLADDVLFAVSKDNWSGWRQAPILAGTMPDTDNGSLAAPAGSMSGLPFVEQRTIDLRHDAGGRRRDKRCLTEAVYLVSNLLLPALLEAYFGRADLCSLDPHPNQEIAGALPLVEVADRGNVPRFVESAVFEASTFEAGQLGTKASFDAAMDIQFCNSNHLRAAGDGACSEADRRAIAAIGDLTPLEVDELLAHIARMFEPDQPGTGTLRTGNSELDRWLNADLARAENALNAAQAIVHVSDARKEPNEPIKNKKKKKRKLVKASCIDTKEEDNASDDGFQQCIRKAKRQLNETGLVVALPPLVEGSARYYQRGTAQFDRLVREFRNSGRGMPWNMSEAEFPEFTAAIARDHAPTGDNLGFVFINDSARGGERGRFPYGVEHIWTAGSGGGDDAGHREDWRGLKGFNVTSRDMLVQVVMAALTDPGARFVQQRSPNGNVIRTFDYFMFRHGNAPYAIRNVRIVLAQNGMVITAYPRANAHAELLAK